MTSFAWPGSPQNAGRVAVILPGQGYSVQRPLLYWAARMLVEQGWHVEAVEWRVTEDALEAPRPFVEAAVAVAFDAAPRAATRLVVAKSFGTHALPWAVDEGVPGVWLTPLLTDPSLASALARGGDAHLAVGGDCDDVWRPAEVGAAGVHTLTVPGADHGLEIAGGWRASARVHLDVLERVARHVEALGVDR
jgi:hypothetical protein